MKILLETNARCSAAAMCSCLTEKSMRITFADLLEGAPDQGRKCLELWRLP
jgi:hypothetical protein